MSGDSTWDYTRHDPAALLAESRRLAPELNADDPDLSRLAARRGKLILWHGWADPALNPLVTVDYYERVLARDAGAREYVRLFMLPGVLHCAGGAGPDNVDWLRAVQDWVERGRAPEQLEASRRERSGAVTRARPLCAYPQRAVYAGQGSTDDAASFTCRARE
jgi:feruloyl esterase